MTAICSKPITSTKEDAWFSAFTSFNSENKSCMLMKTLTSTCVSTVLHMRNIFPEVYFESKSFEGVSLKILKEGDKQSPVGKVQQWLKGVFEAIDKKFLKHLMLDIQDAETSMTLEIYTMSFNYKQDKETLDFLPFTSKSKRHCGFTESNTKLNIINLLQMCSAVTRNSDNLPSKVILGMRLSYNENTPEDYQPKEFLAWKPQDSVFPKQTRSIEIGVTETSHHCFKFINKSCLNDTFFKSMESIEQLSDSHQSLEQTHNTQVPFILSQGSTCFDKNQAEKRGSQPFPKKRIAVENTSRRSDFRNKKVRCVCLTTEKSTTVLPCLACKNFVHAECFGILQVQILKKMKFYCHLCHQPEAMIKCHDKSLIGLKSPADQQKLAVLRKVLKHCTKNHVLKITLKQLKKIAGFTSEVETILNLMVETKLAIPQTKRKSFVIDKTKLTNKLMHYFYGPEYLEHI